MPERDKNLPPTREPRYGSPGESNPRWEDLREQLERASWTNYVKIKYSRQESRQDHAQPQQQDNAVDKPNAKSLHEINRRIQELAREYETTIPGESRRETIANEISELQVLLQNLHKRIK